MAARLHGSPKVTSKLVREDWSPVFHHAAQAPPLPILGILTLSLHIPKAASLGEVLDSIQEYFSSRD
jgi:hypothetical protein